MLSTHRLTQSWRRSLGYLGLFGVTTVTVINVRSRYRDCVQGTDAFAAHTRQQQKKHRFSGMHEPFLTNNIKELEAFKTYFPEYSFLLSTDIGTMKQKHALKTPVKIKSLSECPIKLDPSSNDRHTLIVGGPPALVAGVSLVKSDKKLTYINDERRIPIAFGSAWHLEQDAGTEAPTSYRPTQFMRDQIVRALFHHVTHVSAEKTGFFPWRSLDWIGWIRHPEHWLAGFKVALAFQWFTMFDDRKVTLKRVAKQCVENEKFFQNLNEEFNGKLLLRGNGSIIVARTNEEVAELNDLKAALTMEGRILNIISKEEMMNRYGFLPHGLRYGEKTHDRVISAKFMKILNDSIEQHGGKVIDGTLLNIYIGDKEKDGIAEYQTPNGQKHFLPFSRLIMSLGSQPILKQNNKPLFDIVAARGVSVLSHVYVPVGYKLPPVLVCGETNHATKLTENGFTVTGDDGKSYDVYLMRFTAGACITPNLSDENTASYDGTIAVGLISAVRNTFGSQCRIEPLLVYGCNRQVSRYGETHWIEPFPGIHVQYGAGGGGLTRAPDFVVKP